MALHRQRRRLLPHRQRPTGQLLGVGATTAGTQVITWTPNGGANQRWVFTQQSDGNYTIVNTASNMCMDDYAGATTPGTKVIQWPCTGGTTSGGGRPSWATVFTR
ncbi:RICIN domain-containing protein [Actinosynnema sp. CA-248983]